MSLEDAVHPIEVAEGKVQLTFFNGSADAWLLQGTSSQALQCDASNGIASRQRMVEDGGVW